MMCSAFIKDPVLSSMHYAQRWPWAAINSMLIMGQASAKKYKPRSRQKQWRAMLTGSLMMWAFDKS